MDLLLDTHTLIWYNENESLLSSEISSLINDLDNEIFVSITSFYEIAIKINIGKLKTGKSFTGFYKKTLDNNISILPIKETHLSRYIGLPLFEQHRDPFDRMIVATAIEENLTIATTDNKFNLYRNIVPVIW